MLLLWHTGERLKRFVIYKSKLNHSFESEVFVFFCLRSFKSMDITIFIRSQWMPNFIRNNRDITRP